MLTLLISHGADINATDCRGINPVQLAFAVGHTKCLSILLDQGADESTMKTPQPIVLTLNVIILWIFELKHFPS